MITVSLERDTIGQIISFSVKGHAHYAQKGEDIVCAGVSAIAQTAILGLEQVLHIACRGQQGDGLLICRLPPLGPDLRREANILLETMVKGLDAIAAIYSDNIRILDCKRGVYRC